MRSPFFGRNPVCVVQGEPRRPRTPFWRASQDLPNRASSTRCSPKFSECSLSDRRDSKGNRSMFHSASLVGSLASVINHLHSTRDLTSWVEWPLKRNFEQRKVLCELMLPPVTLPRANKLLTSSVDCPEKGTKLFVCHQNGLPNSCFKSRNPGSEVTNYRISRSTFHFHSFQGSFFLTPLKPRKNGSGFWKHPWLKRIRKRNRPLFAFRVFPAFQAQEPRSEALGLQTPPPVRPFHRVA